MKMWEWHIVGLHRSKVLPTRFPPSLSVCLGCVVDFRPTLVRVDLLTFQDSPPFLVPLVLRVLQKFPTVDARLTRRVAQGYKGMHSP